MSQFQSTSYHVQKPTGVCAVTGQPLEPGEPCFAALVEMTDEQIAEARKAKDPAAEVGLKRVDVSAQAWARGDRPAGVFGYWKTHTPEPNEKKKLLVDDAVLMSLIERLDGADNPERLAFRHVLALVLMRKKLLRYDGTVTGPTPPEAGSDQGAESSTYWKFTPKLDVTKGHFGKWDEARTIEVLDPGLDEAQVEQVALQMGQIFEAEL